MPKKEIDGFYIVVIETIALMVLLIASIIFSVIHNDYKDTTSVNNGQTRLSTQEKGEALQNKLHKDTQYFVLQGEKEAFYTFTPANSSSNGNNTREFSWLKDKLDTLGTNEITVVAQINYLYVYHLSKIKVKTRGNKLCVELSKNNIELLEPVELGSDRIITDKTKTKMLNNNFTQKETQELVDVLITNTYGNLIGNNDLLEQAIDNTEASIETTAKRIGITNLEFEQVDSVDKSNQKL